MTNCAYSRGVLQYANLGFTAILTGTNTVYAAF